LVSSTKIDKQHQGAFSELVGAIKRYSTWTGGNAGSETCATTEKTLQIFGHWLKGKASPLPAK